MFKHLKIDKECSDTVKEHLKEDFEHSKVQKACYNRSPLKLR